MFKFGGKTVVAIVYCLRTVYSEFGKAGRYVYKIGKTTRTVKKRSNGALTMNPNEVIELFHIECEKENSVEKLFHDIFKETNIKSVNISNDHSRQTE
jgi:hypothetical protein